MKDFEYHSPTTLDEALRLLKESSGIVKILAGGTDLIVQMKYGRFQPDTVIDIKKITDLNRLEWGDERGLFIGAAVPVARLTAFAPVAARYGVLHYACSLIGSYQLRSRATVGGNICNAAPSADSAPALLCLEARAIVAGSAGQRSIPLPEFFIGPGKTALAAGELLIGFDVPPQPTQWSGSPIEWSGCYLRHIPRQDMDIAVVGVASLLALEPHTARCSEARIALGAVAPTPIRVAAAESFLIGKTLEPDVLAEAARRASAASRPISDTRGSAGYRREIVEVLTMRTLEGTMKTFTDRTDG